MSGAHGGQTFNLFAAQTTGDTVRVVDLRDPCRFFSFSVVGATSAGVTLQGSLNSSSTTPATLIAWSSDTSGSILSTESTGPFQFVTASITAASSIAGLTGWVSATP